MQVDPIKPQSEPPGTKRLKQKCDALPLTSAFEFKFRRYTLAVGTTLMDEDGLFDMVRSCGPAPAKPDPAAATPAAPAAVKAEAGGSSSAAAAAAAGSVPVVTPVATAGRATTPCSSAGGGSAAGGSSGSKPCSVAAAASSAAAGVAGGNAPGAAAARKAAEGSGTTVLWTNKYQPGMPAQLIGNGAKIAELRKWLSSWQGGY